MGSSQLFLVAVIQGLTEYLPVSSSAHLILLPRLMSWPDQGLEVDVAAHLGTFVAVLVYFRRDLQALGGRLWARTRGRSGSAADDRDRLLVSLLVASVPVLIAGFLLRDLIATSARDPRLIAVTSIVFGLVLGAADYWGRRSVTLESMTRRQAIWIGLAQALALIPGTSRSGVTISAGLLLHMKRVDAARFSFLLSIPVSAAVGVAEVLELLDGPIAAVSAGQLLLVSVLSGLTGLACIHLFLGFLRRRRLTVFAVYRVVLGTVILVMLLASW